MEEVWRWIKGYENMYQISNFGKVRSVDRFVYCEVSPNKLQHVAGKTLKIKTDKKGYSVVYLSKDGKQKVGKIHRLVAQMFIPNPNNLPQVNHKDGCKSNNHVDNLEWCTNSYNQKHAWASGLQPSYEESNGRGRPARPVAMLDLLTRSVLRTFETLASAGRETGINQYNIRSVCIGTRNQAGGYGWKFINKGDDE